MNQPTPVAGEARSSFPALLNHWRERLAVSLGVSAARREEIYLELSKAATLRDLSYWLQLLFAAGIATLGLVLNSPAVIIGAMLISPLMGPILAGGLSFAAGDLILGIRALVTLAVSALISISFAMVLVWLLPFREMTAEIAGRTQPTTLDLAVALFSGAIGSLAICREVKGVVTSIPGVAIAVALMPPLCVVGYGAGIAFSQNAAEGWRIASGGGLLFLTNLVAITFTAMIVFLALHIDTSEVREKVREWRRTDRESVFARYVMMRFHLTDRVRNLGGLGSRLLMILLALMLLVIPLTRTLSQLRGEITRQQEENHIRRAATQIWQQYFEKQRNGEARPFLDHIAVATTDNQLRLNLRVFDAEPCTEAEKTEYVGLLAERLGRSAETIHLQLLEVPTASALLSVKARQEIATEMPPSVAELRANYSQGISAAMQELRLPPMAQLLGFRIITSSQNQSQVIIVYLSERDIESDAQALIQQDIRARLMAPALQVTYERIPTTFGALEFRRNTDKLPTTAIPKLEHLKELLNQYSQLGVEVIVNTEPNEPPDIATKRFEVVRTALLETSSLSAKRITHKHEAEAGRTTVLRLQHGEPKK